MKQHMGFKGAGFWGLVVLIVVGVWWIESRFGTNAAGWAVIGASNLISFLLGSLLNMASSTAALSNTVEMKRAEMRIQVEHARYMRQEANSTNRFMQKAISVAQAIDRARSRQGPAALPEPDEFDQDDLLDDRYDVDLNSIDYRRIRPS